MSLPNEHAENDRVKVAGTRQGFDMDYIPGLDDGVGPKEFDMTYEEMFGEPDEEVNEDE